MTDSLFGILAWGRGEDMIYGIHSALEVAARVPVIGGPLEPLTVPDPTDESGHWMPEPLPRRGGALVTIRTVPQRKTDAYVAVIDPAGRVQKLTQGFGSMYAATGYVVFARMDGMLYAAPFDLAKLKLRREPVAIVRDVAVSSGFFASFPLSLEGALLRIPASQARRSNALAWIDRSGREFSTLVEKPFIGHPRLSPDGNRVAFEAGWACSRTICARRRRRSSRRRPKGAAAKRGMRGRVEK